MRIAALGRTHWLSDSIHALRNAGHEIVLIGTGPAAPEYSVSEKDFEALASELGCPYFCDVSLNRDEHLARIDAAGADMAISVNWPTLIGRAVIDRFRHGIVNAHAGDLPRYRGNACPNWAILSGEDKVVLTLHQMGEGLDDGPVLLKKVIPLTQESYIGDIYRLLTEAIPKAYVEAIDGLSRGTLKPEPQTRDPSVSLRCFPRIPQDAEIDWALPATALARLVRASAEPFRGAFTHLGEVPLTIWRARAGVLGYPALGLPGQVVSVDAKTGEVAVLTGEGTLLLEVVESDGGRIAPSSIIRSGRIRLGRHLSERVGELERKVAVLESRIRELLPDQP